jgi:TRAP transporter T-component
MSMNPIQARRLRCLFALAAVVFASGCASIVGNASDRLAAQLGSAVTNSNDPATVRDGLPAYLLLIDGLVEGQVPGDKRNASLLFAAAELNGAYAGNFTGDDRDRAKRLAAKALDYARRGTCAQDKALCAALDKDVDAFAAAVAAAPGENIAGHYALAAAWVGFLQANSEDWGAIADLPKIEALLARVVATDPGHARGMPRVYLGVLNSLRPADGFGAQPLRGRHCHEPRPQPLREDADGRVLRPPDVRPGTARPPAGGSAGRRSGRARLHAHQRTRPGAREGARGIGQGLFLSTTPPRNPA